MVRLAGTFAAVGLLLVVGCGKRVANRGQAKNTPPVEAFKALQATDLAPTDVEGNFVSDCVSGLEGSAGQIRTAKFTGNLLVWKIQTFSDADCKKATSTDEWRAIFVLTPSAAGGEYSHAIRYTQGDFADFSESLLLQRTGIPFLRFSDPSDSNIVYYKK